MVFSKTFSISSLSWNSKNLVLRIFLISVLHILNIWLFKLFNIFIVARTSLKRRLDFLLDTMEISMEQIIAWPSVLRNRERRIEERHKLLKHLGLAEYDATKAGYVSLQRLVSGKTDVFCSEVAHISEQQYFDFIKTLWMFRLFYKLIIFDEFYLTMCIFNK